MKTKIYIIAISLFSSIAALGQTPDWLWAKSAGGNGFDAVTSVTTDNSGNIIVTGYFKSHTIIFGSATLLNEGSGTLSSDIFLVKYDVNGNVLWAKNTGGTSDDMATSIATDASGNIFITGYFNSPTITFGSTTLTNTSDTKTGMTSDIFLVKYDASGNVLWAKSAGGYLEDRVNSITADASGNILITGFFKNNIIVFDSDTLKNTGSGDFFLAKYNTNGKILWAKSAGGSGFDCAQSVSTDISGNIFVAGYFSSPNIVFGSTTLTNTDNANTTDIFVVKYNDAGKVLWAKSAEGGYSNDVAQSIAIDPSGNVFVTGYFNSPTIIFGSSTLTKAGLFIAKYDVNGNVLWAKGIEGTATDKANSITIDASGNSYMAGTFNNPNITFGSISLSKVGNSDIFLVKYDANGNVIWAKNAGGNGFSEATSVTADATGNIIIAGYFRGFSIIFGSTTLKNNDTKGDVFLGKLSGAIETKPHKNKK